MTSLFASSLLFLDRTGPSWTSQARPSMPRYGMGSRGPPPLSNNSLLLARACQVRRHPSAALASPGMAQQCSTAAAVEGVSWRWLERHRIGSDID